MCNFIEEDVHSESVENSNKPLSQANFYYSNKPGVPILREEYLEGDDFKSLKEKFKSISFIDIGYLPLELQTGLCDVVIEMYNNLENNFTNQLGIIIVRELPPREKLWSFATYRYDQQKQIGIIEINRDKYAIEVVVTQEFVNQFKSSIRHEIGHHLYQIHNLENIVSEFYSSNDKYIFIHFYKGEIYRMKGSNEFFADGFDRFCAGNLTRDSKVYDLIEKIYQELRIKK